MYPITLTKCLKYIARVIYGKWKNRDFSYVLSRRPNKVAIAILDTAKVATEFSYVNYFHSYLL